MSVLLYRYDPDDISTHAPIPPQKLSEKELQRKAQEVKIDGFIQNFEIYPRYLGAVSAPYSQGEDNFESILTNLQIKNQ